MASYVFGGGTKEEHRAMSRTSSICPKSKATAKDSTSVAYREPGGWYPIHSFPNLKTCGSSSSTRMPGLGGKHWGLHFKL